MNYIYVVNAINTKCAYCYRGGDDGIVLAVGFSSLAMAR